MKHDRTRTIDYRVESSSDGAHLRTLDLHLLHGDRLVDGHFLCPHDFVILDEPDGDLTGRPKVLEMTYYDNSVRSGMPDWLAFAFSPCLELQSEERADFRNGGSDELVLALEFSPEAFVYGRCGNAAFSQCSMSERMSYVRLKDLEVNHKAGLAANESRKLAQSVTRKKIRATFPPFTALIINDIQARFELVSGLGSGFELWISVSLIALHRP